jgi:ATP-dependent RNA circularization protein (DNA/RNA ligase family)
MQDTFKFVKYKRIPHLDEIPHILDNSVKVYEKIDGGNVQIRKINGRIFSGSRAHFLAREKSFTQDWFKDFQRWVLKDYRFYNIPENLIIYGEWSSKHTLDYNLEFTNRFFLIDIFDLDKNKFLFYSEGRDKLLNLKIEGPLYLRTLFSGKTDIEKLKEIIEKSDYRGGNMEGVVIKDYNLQEFAKLWTSSIKRKGVVTQLDVKSIYSSLKDGGEIITKEKLLRELKSDLRKSGRDVPIDKIEKTVEEFYMFLSFN